jgi:hypothetical protein
LRILGRLFFIIVRRNQAFSNQRVVLRSRTVAGLAGRRHGGSTSGSAIVPIDSLLFPVPVVVPVTVVRAAVTRAAVEIVVLSFSHLYHTQHRDALCQLIVNGMTCEDLIAGYGIPITGAIVSCTSTLLYASSLARASPKVYHIV